MVTLASLVACLTVGDVLVGLAAGNAYRPQGARLGAITRYFDYGRSTEGKVRAMLDSSGGELHPLARAGWIEPLVDQPTRPGKGQDLLVAAYGMSFTASVMNHMQKENPDIAVRFGGGPGATLSHSFALYQADRGHHEARVVLLGILASSLPGIMTVTHMTWNFEAPSPHFYPRFELRNGELVAHRPPIGSLAELQAAAQDQVLWRAMVQDLAGQDVFYDSFVFGASPADASVLARLARRGWGQRSKRNTLARFHDEHGFRNELGLIDVSRALVGAFVDQARRDGKLPVVLAINDSGYSDDLHRVLAPIMADGRAVYLSTHEIAPATDRRNFLKDGHFLPEKDRALGRALASLIREHLGRRRL